MGDVLNMKLTDFAICLFSLFLCMFLGLELRLYDLNQTFLSRISLNRQMDRICEDSMMDVVVKEQDTGEVLADEHLIEQQFDTLMMLSFGVNQKEEQKKLYEIIPLKEFLYAGNDLSMEQTDRIRSHLEALANADRQASDANLFAMCFPYVPREDWYQNITGNVFFTVIDPGHRNFSWETLNRGEFSGSRIEKRHIE